MEEMLDKFQVSDSGLSYYGIRSKMPNTDRWNILKMLTSLKFYSKSIASMSGESSNKTQEAHLTKDIRNSRRSAQRTALP